MIYDELLKLKMKWLRWVLDFCNTDLEKIKEIEREDYTRKALELALDYSLASQHTSTQTVIDERGIANSLRSEYQFFIHMIQAELTSLLDFFLFERDHEKYNMWSEEPSLWPRVYVGLQLRAGYVPTFYIHPDRFKIELDVELTKKYEPIVTVASDDVWSDNVNSWNVVEYYMGQETDAEWAHKKLQSAMTIEKILSSSQTNYHLLDNLCVLLDGLTPKCIQRCNGCNRLFLSLTKIKRIYCNPSCASRSIAQMKRDQLKKDPMKYQAYLKKQKQYAKKSYQEKKKAQLGPNVRVGRKKEG